MDEQFLAKVDQELLYLNKIQTGVERRIHNAPPGILCVRQSKRGVVQFYKQEQGEKAYIPMKDTKMKQKLAQKEYDHRIQQLTERKMKALRRFKESYPAQSLQQVYGTMHMAKREFIVPVELPDEEFAQKWQEISYEGKPFADSDASAFYTDRRERVRSKSEVIIANMLDACEIPYRYEYPHMMKSLGHCIYPDFTVLNKRTRKEYVWEHFGRMTDAAYANDSIWKLSMYHANGYFTGENLLFTMESQEHPLKTQDVRNLIEHYLI